MCRSRGYFISRLILALYKLKIKNQILYLVGTKDWKRYFLHGGCFWFENYLHKRIEDSVLMINRMEEHCAIQLSNPMGCMI